MLRLGYRRQIPARDLPRHVKAAHLIDFSSHNKILLEGSGVVLGANIIEPTTDENSNDCTGDIISFEVPSSALSSALPVASVSPPVGANVWLAGREVRDHVSPSGKGKEERRVEEGAVRLHKRKQKKKHREEHS